MHTRAAEWDKENHMKVPHYTVINGKFVPRNRPCDWCGKTVDIGYIHHECASEEAKEILDWIF